MIKISSPEIRSANFFALLSVLILLTPSLRAAPPTPVTQKTSAPSSQKLAELSLEELMQIPVFKEPVISVSRQDSDVRRSAAAIFVITQEMIRRSGATSIPEILRMVPGLEVARSDANKWAITSRGFNDRFANKLLVQIDGRVLYNLLFSGVYWDTVDYPLSDIERIEVIRGPGASVWGANAVNGVINIITKKSQDTQGGKLTGGGGTEDRGFGDARYGGKIGKDFSYRMYGKGSKTDRGYGVSDVAQDQWWATRGGFRTDWQKTSHDNITFQGDYFNSISKRQDVRPTLTDPFLFTDIEYERSFGENGLLRWNHEAGKDSNWALQFYYDGFDRGSPAILGSAFRADTYDLDFHHQFPWGDRQKIVYGFGERLTNIGFTDARGDNGLAVRSDDPHLLTNLPSTFLQDEFMLWQDKLYLTGGTKLEHNYFTGFEVQPTARLLFTPTLSQSLWTAFSRAVRTPNYVENDLQITQPPARAGLATFPHISPNPDFKSEELLAYELGYRIQLTEKLFFDAATFYNVYRNLKTTLAGATISGPAPGTTFIPVALENRMKGETYGVELAGNWQPMHDWRLYGAYTFLQIQLHRDGGVGASAENAEGQSPEHQVYLQSSWNLPFHLEFDLISRYVDTLRKFTPKVNSYVTLDARLSWKASKNLEISLVGQNLAEPHHLEFGTSSILISPYVETQRSVYATATFKWGEK